jgi:3-hydroxybutyryl-CoA dehydrogenase
VSEQISKVGVVGCGTMGAGISELVAGHGMEVVFVEVDEHGVEKGWERIRTSVERGVSRGRIDETERDEILGRISGTAKYADLADCGFVIEAVPEELELKQQVFAEIDEHIAQDALMATNTSSLPVLDIAVHTRHPNHVLGFHFFNPAQVMELIELVRTVVTDESVVERAESFAERIGKTPVIAGDRPGFIANQLLFPYINQAIGMVETGYATKEDVDAAMRFGAGHPMGPVALADLIGLDTMLGTTESIWGHFRQTRFAPQPILRQLTSAGYAGRKSGRGFYRYEEAGSPQKVEEGSAREPADPDTIADWSRIGVVGTGTMATGIAQVFAQAGYEVVIRGRGRHKSEGVIDAISKALQRQVDKGRMDEEQRVEVIGRLTPSDDYADLAGSDLVIEAVAEDLGVKEDVFANIDEVVGEGTVVATTTSSLAVIDCAMATSMPERIVGLHFFNPAAVMKLVEIVPTVRTDDAVLEKARAVVDAVGKVGVLCADRAGFIVNALLFPYLNDAVRMLESHYATTEEIDRAMKLGAGHPMGPFELIDIVGLDVTLAIIERLHAEFREPSFAPSPLLRYMVEAGYLGRKAGRGFYVYG